jgi:isopentenyldiphosphate isomerase
MNDEYLPLVDAAGKTVGKALRSQCHGNPGLIHPVVHLHVHNSAHKLFLQKRSAQKDLFPGFWDTAVGGHVGLGEDVGDALLREAAEELGIDAGAAKFLYSYLMRNRYESEYVYTYMLSWNKKFAINREEISEGRFFTVNQITEKLGRDFFTPNFEQEWSMLRSAGAF